jgi:hypothetical protein
MALMRYSRLGGGAYRIADDIDFDDRLGSLGTPVLGGLFLRA